MHLYLTAWIRPHLKSSFEVSRTSFYRKFHTVYRHTRHFTPKPFSASHHYRITMFTPLGLFKNVPCPQNQHCTLTTCIFSHKPISEPSVDQSILHGVNIPLQEAIPEPPAKKAKLETTDDTQRTSTSPPRKGFATPSYVSSNQVNKPQLPVHKSISRPISPARKRKKRIVKTEGPRLAPRDAPQESLNPRMVAKAPAAHNIRLAILTKLHEAMVKLNDQLAKDEQNSHKYLVLTPNELVVMALDEEENAAKNNPGIYRNIINPRIVKLAKMSKENWVNEVKAHLNARYYKLDPIQEQQESKEPVEIETGLSVKEEIVLAKKMVTPLEGLEQFGYVTKAPTQEQIESAQKGVTESKGWEKCDRCSGRFQVFPGRRADGSLTTGGSCKHHPGKPLWPTKQQTDHITGPREAYYSCCNESIGTSSGCTIADTHAFKVSEAKRLATVLQFEQTPVQPDKGPLPPVSFDCEMGYTTMGMEVIRLTAVSWPQGKELLDIIVRPIGEVLDLNSHYSGVFPEHYAKAIPYGESIPNTSADGKETRLQIVDSPAAARSLLFQHLQPDTPLIGHAIDNDLNACRIIHPTVIDTVLLYPTPRGLPIRMSLKTLSRNLLDRDIQVGGSQGHDSKEDAVATGDLVRVKVAEKWKMLKAMGWVFENGELVAPPGADANAAERVLSAGQKRKDPWMAAFS